MNKPLRENSFDSLENELGAIDTMPERRAREKRARLRDDGRSGRSSAPYRELNAKVSPELKARVVNHCRSKDIFIRDFVSKWLEHGLDEEGDK